MASPDGRDGSVSIHQDVSLYTSKLGTGERVDHALTAGRHAWLQVISGDLEANGEILAAGDGLAISDEPGVTITTKSPAEVMLFDLA